MKKFSKLLAVLVAIAVIICPMTSAIVANATSGGSYSIAAEDANNVVLTINSNDGFIVYQATVTFNNASAFQDSYSSDGYTNGLKVVDYTLVSGSKNAYNAPAISAQENGSSLVILVAPTDAATLDLYSEIQIGIRVANGSTANLTKIQAADEGDVEDDPTLLDFGNKVAADGTVDSTNNDAATTGTTHTHNYTKDTPHEVTAPTCTAYGVYRKTCTVCGAVDSSATYTGTVMAAHTPSNVQNATEDFLASAATCTAPASYYYECTVCHAAIESGMAGYTGTFTSGAAAGHNMTAHAASAATCTTAGNSAYWSCSVCNKYFSDSAGNTEIAANSWVIAATGHTSVADAAVAPTCTETGLTAGAHCSVCNAVLTAQTVVPATGHTSVTDPAVAPTCTETGLTAGAHCSVCNAVLTAQTVVPALGHDYQYASNSNGTHAVTCTRCDFSDTEECDTAGAMGACSKCGYVVSSGEPVHDTNIRINDVVATIGSAIDLRYRVTKSTVSSYDHYQLVITPKKYDNASSNLYNVIDGTPVVLALDRSTASYDIYYYRNTFIHELGLRITAKVNCYDSSNNLVAYSDETTIVPAQMLTDTYNSSSASVKTVVVDLLNMCSAVQTQFAANAPLSDLATTVNSGNLANKGVSQEYATASYGELNTANTTTWNPSTNLNQTNNRLATNIVVGKAPNIQYVVYKGTSLDREDLELNISYTSHNSANGDSGVVNYTISGSDWGTSGTKLTYNIEDLAYYDGNVTVTATLTYKGVLAWTNQFSVESGINANLTNPGASAALLDTMNALAVFGKSARVYTGFDI